MADNVTLNAGTGGSVVATDEVTRATVVQHVQYVKLMNGTDAAIDVIGGDATNGLDVDVTRLPALPAGTNNIGDVDVLSVVPGTGATAMGKAVDAVAGATDTGIAALFVRDDALTTLTPVDGDYAPGRVDSTGALHVRVSAGGIAGIADDAAFTPSTSEVLPVGFHADETATDSVDEGDIGAARITLDRKQIMALYAHTAGGYTPGMLISAATTNATNVKASAGKLGFCVVTNINAAVRYLKFYNTAAAPTVGTDVPVLVFAIPGATTGGGIAVPIPPQGLNFTTGLSFALTTGVATADTGAVAANELVVSYGFT